MDFEVAFHRLSEFAQVHHKPQVTTLNTQQQQQQQQQQQLPPPYLNIPVPSIHYPVHSTQTITNSSSDVHPHHHHHHVPLFSENVLNHIISPPPPPEIIHPLSQPLSHAQHHPPTTTQTSILQFPADSST